ncbi:efflux transporter outer membrane subunit [Blastochloris viridis]|uniref:Cation efflux system protein CusC n=1 Tax=Blastochloris viridis TaxID=1079 RepID=A0A0H5BPY8_BLAVI|nr:efflux transporter outer membrane subunit [Blastochloris viridis]ALK09993.1 Toluene efflux pump outer membrane protein TtgI precursor [Blastochloris viridis]BAS00089.1 RND efflux system [Blastochloris viridis]CUU42657.1 Cation efflux system protein CusC precursor [Blastochloris viridis]
MSASRSRNTLAKPDGNKGHRRRRAALKRLAVLLASIALAGCVVGPDYQKPSLALPATWGATKRAAPPKPPELAEWWRRLNDPLLNDLIQQAVAGNLDVATSKARIREARASHRQAVGALFPTVTNSESASRSTSASSSAGSGTTANQFQAGLDASWEIDLFGANRRAIEAARYGMDAAEEELRSTLLTLIGDVASNYVEARGYQARIALAQRTATSQQETAALTRRKFEAGASSAVDVANAAGQAASTEANIPDREASYAQAVHRLSILTGRPPAALTNRLRKQAAIPRPRLPVPTGIPAGILLTRPDVRLAERQYAQYTAKVGQAEAARYPSVGLTGSIATSGTGVGDLGKSSSISWSFGPTVTVPIFNGGQLKAAVEVAEAQRDQYFLAYRSSVLTALEDVENAIVSLAQERIKSGKLASSVMQYREAATLGRSLYQSGSQSFLNLLEAERSLYSAEDSLIASQVAITTDYIALNKALGGGWSGTIDASKPEVIDTNTGPHLAVSGTRSNPVANQN